MAVTVVVAISVSLMTITPPARADETLLDVACRDRPTLTREQARALRTDGLPLAGQPAVPMEEILEWGEPAYTHASWTFSLHNLEWTYALVELAAEGDLEAEELLREVLRTWFEVHGEEASSPFPPAWHSHPVSLRTGLAACALVTLDLAEARPLLDGGLAWLLDPAHDDGDWNHGIDQALTILIGGCVEGRRDVVDHAVARLDRHRRNAIDAQGVVNEQAPAYQRYVMNQYGDIVVALEACGLDADRFRRTQQSLAPMLVQATRPDGTLAPMGDTSATAGGAPPSTLSTGTSTPLHAVYRRGFAFARDRWGTDGTWFGMRFGDFRVIHGHRDHASLLYDVRGVPVLTEAGHSGYDPGPFRGFERSHPAHNIVTVRNGGRFLWELDTPLIHDHADVDHLSITVEGRPYTGISSHRRSALVAFEPHAIVVRDVVRAGVRRTVDQLWHLPPGWTIERRDTSVVIARGPDGYGVRIHQLEAADAVDITLGARDPLQGWVSVGADERAPAPTVAAARSGTAITYTTVIVPTGPGLPRVSVGDREGAVALRSEGRTRFVTFEDENLALRSANFVDAVDSVFREDIAWLADAGLTSGCNAPASDRYCPDEPTTRGEMAAFLTRAFDLPASDRDRFRDDDASIFEHDVQALAAAGITTGCNPPHNDRFCPRDPVTRGAMAAFLVRALDLPAAAGDSFQDDDGSVFERDAEALAAAGVTAGCNPPHNDHFCPDDPVTRGQMAAFLHRALDSPGPDGP